MNSSENPKCFLGINKGHFSGASLVSGDDVELHLRERFSRVSQDSGWPISEVEYLDQFVGTQKLLIADHCLGDGVLEAEQKEHDRNHLYEKLLTRSLTRYSQYFNNNPSYVTHHRCHASAARSVSPLTKALVLVIDGAGSFRNAFPPTSPECLNFGNIFEDTCNDTERVAESRTIYFHQEGVLSCAEKEWQLVRPIENDQHNMQFVFNQGLATYLDFFDTEELGANVQEKYENDLMKFLKATREKFEFYDNLIITGSSALNCLTNMRIFDSKLYSNIYVPPFPGDESIAPGAAFQLKYFHEKETWKPTPIENQIGNFGPKSSNPSEADIFKTFSNYQITKPENICVSTAKLLTDRKVIGWFQDRSESGSRALGYRSILCHPYHPWSGLKERSYGISCLWDMSHEYFHVPEKFESPFMSYAPRVRMDYRSELREVCDSNGSVKMQTVRNSQNLKFYNLLTEFGVRSDLFYVLNANMCMPGEPLAETIADALRVFERTNLDAMVIGEFMISKKEL